MQTSLHSIDDAVLLQAQADGTFTGRTTPAYWNMVGPYGGITAAAIVQAVMQHPQLLGEPIALTVNYAGALAQGEFTVRATPVRTNRSTQHWMIMLEQPGADGESAVTTTATMVTAVRRETWSVSDAVLPQVPNPQACQRLALGDTREFVPEWLKAYEMRIIQGSIPAKWDDSGDSSLSQLWVRDAPARALDFVSLAALADVFFPRMWLRRARRVPAGTVSITTYFHADSALLTATGSGYLLAQAQAQEFRNGFCDQTAQLWNEAGALLATSNQVVYYKE